MPTFKVSNRREKIYILFIYKYSYICQ